jgi:hypothetical protein
MRTAIVLATLLAASSALADGLNFPPGDAAPWRYSKPSITPAPTSSTIGTVQPTFPQPVTRPDPYRRPPCIGYACKTFGDD